MTDPAPSPPLRLSVVVVGRDGYRTLHPILACLAEQTIAGSLEVIAVLPEEEDPGPAGEAAGRFGAFVPVPVGPFRSRGWAAAKGVRRATAPLVAFSENHCFPDPDWAEALLAAFDGDVVGVAPAILNGNPEAALSWAAYATGYASFAPEGPAREVEEMPVHNAAYRRSALEARDNRLEALLADDRALQRDLRAAGGRFRFAPAARSRHINEATYRLALGLNYVNGRRYGAARSEAWGPGRRLAFAAAAPLLSLAVLRNNLRRVAGLDLGGRRGAKLYLDLWLLSAAHALGEAVSYLGRRADRFPFIEGEAFMITERLGRRGLGDPRLARFIRSATPLRQHRTPASP